MTKKLYLIDASGYIYRSYFAIKQMTNSKGESTNALFGFIRALLKLMKDFEPTHLAAIFDGPNNGHARISIYPEYKAHRSAMPPDLLHQIHWAKEFCNLAGIPELMIPKVEADDTLGSIAVWAAGEDWTTYICTGDKDLSQLVNDKIFILNTFKENLIMDAEEVEKQFGVLPSQIVDFLAITGDASDNIPGISGFGPKTAADLLKQFGSLKSILENPEKIPGKKKQETIIKEKELALISQRLVQIDTTVPFPQTFDFFQKKPLSGNELRDFYSKMNFSAFTRELEQASSPLKNTPVLHQEVDYQLVDNEEELNDLVDLLSKESQIAIDTETTGLRPLEASLVGIGLGIAPQKAWYIPTNGKLGFKKVMEKLRPLLENPTIGFYGHNIKYDLHILQSHGIKNIRICFDTLIASYLLNSHSRQHSLDHLSLEYFEKIKIPIEDLIGKGKNQITMADVPLEKITTYCCEDVDYTVRLQQKLKKELEERGMHALFYDLELPLLPILAQMEKQGIYIDVPQLQSLGKEIEKELATITSSVYELAGEPFNLNSPKQLSYILFEKLEISPPKKTATGFSTNAEVLEGLKKDHPIASLLLEYRTLEKLRSTYVETLPLQINPKTGRIHCTFNQSGTATGRLSCQDPNLQNIPVRTSIGRKIREVFKPQKEGWSYLSADYSQIELRILAHLSEDEQLMKAFQQNEDIHTFTASLIFNIPLSSVSPEQRYQAKAVNFGIMYGQQAFGLSQELGIDPKTASVFIQKYFERYEKVKTFIEACKKKAKEEGKATTLYGRERLIPEIHSSNAIARNMAERLAVNTPIQGTQADLIKMAMLEVDKQMSAKQLKSLMILQIHDELIFEVPDHEIEEMSELVKKAMTGVIDLKIPLIVDIHIGKNWKEC